MRQDSPANLTENETGLAARLAAAEKALAARDKTIRALVARERARSSRRASTYGTMEENSSLHEVVRRKAQEVKTQYRLLEQSEERFSTAFEHAPIGVALLSPAGRFLRVNRALCNVIGYSELELLRCSIEELTYPEEVETTHENFRRLLSGESASIHVENRYVHGRGHAVHVLVDCTLVRDGNGEPLHIISQIQDISDRKRAEEELRTAHAQLIDVSRQAGMAEVATSVLHNVGNVLNSVNISASIVAQRLRTSKAADLARVVAMLDQHAGDLGAFITTDARGKHLPVFLHRLNERLEAERRDITSEIQSLTQNIEHIKEIVAMQQNYGKVGGVLESVQTTELVEDALRMDAESLSRHAVRVVREFAETPAMMVEKHKVLQILVNLIRNAKQACNSSERSDKELRVSVFPHEGCARIVVTDNGIGIPPENFNLIFNHGFTTKKTGHGFGLHNSANAARELGGSLVVHSEGRGFGAAFTLTLPFSRPTPSKSASARSAAERVMAA